MLENGINYGFYASLTDKRSGYLDDNELFLAYRIPNNTELIFKKKKREIEGIPEKQLQKWNSKKEQKSFMESVVKKGFSFLLFSSLSFFPSFLLSFFPSFLFFTFPFHFHFSFFIFSICKQLKKKKKAYIKVQEALQKGLDPNFVSDAGETPLMMAVVQDDPQMIMMLVKQGGSFLDYRTPDWKTPVHRAVILGHEKGGA